MYDQNNTYLESDDVLKIHRLFADERGRSLATVRRGSRELLYCHDTITRELAMGLILIHLGELSADTTLTGMYPRLMTELGMWMERFRNGLVDKAGQLEGHGNNPYLTQSEILLLAKWERELRRLAADVTNQVGLSEYD